MRRKFSSSWLNRHMRNGCLFFILALLLTGCANRDEKLTIEPYRLSEKEKSLISKTGVDSIEFFHLNGVLKKGEDFQLSVEVYKNGNFKEELLSTSGEPKAKYKNSLISFALSRIEGEEKMMQVIAGIPGGHATASYPNKMTSSSYSNLIDKKITLEKDSPVYLAAWLATSKDHLSSVGGGDGQLPDAIEEAELSLLYKAVWTDKDN